jgi:hypothetical protein
VVVKLCVIVKMEHVMNNLTYNEFKNIYDDNKNLSNKPIFILFKADW